MSGRRPRTSGTGSFPCIIIVATGVAARNGRPAGEQGVEDAPERVEVGATVHPPAQGLLGARYSAVPITVCVAVSAWEPAASPSWVMPKSSTRTRPSAGIRDVRRLDVPVHQSAGVRGIERGRHLLPDLDDLLDGHGAVRDPVGEARAGQELHDDVGRVVLDAAVVHRDDAGVAEARGRPASRSNRAAPVSSGSQRRSMVFTATSRPSTVSVPRQTSPMPPRPMGSSRT